MRRALAFLAVFLCVSFCAFGVQAYTYTWANFGTDWGTGANWGGSVPGPADVGLFTSPTPYGYQPNVGEVNTIGGIWQTGGAAVNVTGGSPLTINGATINGNANTGIELDPGAGAVSISAPVVVGGSQQWLNNSSSALTFMGPVYPQGNTVTVNGSGQTSITGGLGVNGGPGGLVVGSGANVTLSTSAGATPNLYTGATTINGGMLTLQAPAAPAISTDAQMLAYLSSQGLTKNLLAWFDPSSPANYVLTGGSVTTLINLSPSNSASVGNATQVTGSNTTLGGTYLFDGPTLTNNNPNFNGKTTLYFDNSTVLGNLNVSALNNSSYTIFAIEAKSSNPGTSADHFMGTTGAGPSAWTGNSSLQLGYKNDTTFLAGQFSNDLAANAPFFTGAEVAQEYTVQLSTSTGRTLYNGGTPVPGGYITSTVGLTGLGTVQPNSPFGATDFGVIGASYYSSTADTGFNGNFQGDVGEILMFNTALTPAQQQVINSYLQYKWYNPTTLPITTPVTLSGGGTLNLGGVGTTIGSLSSTDPTTHVQLGTATLTTGGLNTNTVFAGSISGAGGLTKVGGGLMTLTGTNTYTGNTAVGAGTLQIAGPSALPAGSLVTMGSATFSYLNDGSGNNGTIQTGTGPGSGNNITLAWNTNIATINVGPLVTSNTGNTVAFGALSMGGSAAALNGTIIFTAANGYQQSYTALNLPGLTGQGTTLDPTSTTLQIGNVTNQMSGVIPGNNYDTLILAGTTVGNTITGSITDSLSYNGTGAYTPVTANGTGQWIISGTNLPYHGNTTVSSGSLAFQNNYLPVNSPVLLGTATLQLLNNGIGASVNNTTINTAYSSGSGTVVINGSVTPNIYVGSVGGTNSGNTIFVSVLANGTSASATTNTINFLGGNGYQLSVGTLGLSGGAGASTTLNPTSTTLSILGVLNQMNTNSGYDTMYLDGTSAGNVVSGVISDRPGYVLQSSGGSLKGETNLSVNAASTWGSFTPNGSALWILTTSESYHGWTDISAGTLQLGTGIAGQDGALPSAGANTIYPYIVNNGTLLFNLNGPQTANYSITGYGSLVTIGGNVLTLTGTGNTYTGTTTISNGTLQLGAGGNSGAIASSPIVNNSVLVLDQSNSVSYTGAVSGSGAIYQVSSGTTLLSSAAGFTGTIGVNSGAFGGTFSALGASATIANGAALVAGNGAAGSVTLGGLSFAGNGTITAGGINGFYSSTGTGAAVNVSGNNGLAANGGAGAVVINLSGQGPVVPGAAYHLLSYSGAIQGTGFSGFAFGTLPTLPNNGTLALVNNAGYVDATLSLSNYPIWTGANGTAWDTTTQNWQSFATSNPTNFNPNDFAYFGDGAGTTTVSINTAVAPYAAYFANNTSAYTLTGTSGISGAAALVMNGAGSLTINNSNAYTGGTHLYNGTLNVGNSAALGNAASTLTLAGGTLNNGTVAAMTLPNYPIVLQGNTTFLATGPALSLGTGAVTLAANSTLNVSASTLTVGGVISGNYGLTTAGQGVLLLNGANTYTGPTTIGAGVTRFGQATLQAPAGTVAQYQFNGTVGTVANGATIPDSVGGHNGTLTEGGVGSGYVAGVFGQAALQLAGSSYVTAPYSSALGLNAYTVNTWVDVTTQPAASTSGPALFSTRYSTDDTFDLQFVQLTGGSNELHADIGNGSAWLTTAGNYTAPGLLSGWNMITYTVNSSGYSIYVNGSAVVTNAAYSTAGTPLFMKPGQELSMGAQTAGGTTWGNFLQGSLDDSLIVNGAMSAGQVQNLYLGGVGQLPSATPATISSGGTLDMNGTAQQVASLSGPGTVANSSTGAAALTISGGLGTSATFPGNIAGNVSLTMAGSGLQGLSGNNTYTGATTITSGTLQFQGANGSTGLVSGGSIGMTNGGFLSIANDGMGSGGTISLGAGNSSIVSSGANATMTIDARGLTGAYSNNVVAFGILSNSTTANAYNATYNFTGANGYTQSYAGLNLSGAAGAATTLNPVNTTVVINGNVINQESTFTNNHYDNLTLAGSTAGNTINGTIFDSSGYTAVGYYDTRLTKTGPSQWVLAGSNTYHGPTTINGGTLALGPNGSINNTAAIVIAGGATLDVSQISGFALQNSQSLYGSGNYYVNGSMTVNSGAAVSPGTLAIPNVFTYVPSGLGANSAGTLNVGSLTLQPGSLMGFELASGSSPELINVANTLTINGGNVLLTDSSGTNQFVTPGTYPLATYGALAGSPANLSAANLGMTGLYTFSASGNTLDVNVAVANGWVGGSGPYNWSNGANWTSGTQPTSGSAAVFAGTSGLANTNNLVGLNLPGMAFAAGAGAFTLSGNSLSLSGPIVNSSAATQTVGLAVQLMGNQTITAGGGNIVLAGAIGDAGSGYGITTGGAYIVALSAGNTFSGPTTVAGGQLRLSNGLALQNSTLTLSAGTVTFDSSVSPAAFTLGGLSGGNNIALANLVGAPVALSVGNNGATTTFSGVLSGPGSLNVSGGELYLSGANTFYGNTLISGGILKLANASALQNSALDTSGAGLIDWGSSLTAVTLGGLTNGGSLYLQNDSGAGVNLSIGNNSINNASSATISGGGTLTKVGGGLQILSGNNSYTGGTIISAGTLQFAGGSTLASVPTSGTVQLTGGSPAVGVLSINVDGTGSGQTIAGPSFILNNTASGLANTINVGNNGSANTGNTVSMGTLMNGLINAAPTTTFYFTATNGYLQSYSVLGLCGSGGDNTDLYPVNTSVSIGTTGGTAVVNREAAVVAGHYNTLTLDGETTGNIIYGSIINAAGFISVGNGDTRITKQNSSQWILAAPNYNAGPTSIAGGTLQLGSGLAGQDGTLYSGTNGTVTFTNSATLAYAMSPTAGALGMAQYVITGPGYVNILSGSVTFTGVDAYTLPTTIAAGGTLALGLNGSTTGSITSTPQIVLASGAVLDVSAVSPWSVHSGQTLIGTGNWNVAGTATDPTGATILPGSLAANSAGTLNTGGLNLSGGTVSYEMGANQDLINVTGAGGLNITGGGINLYNSSGTAQFSTVGTWPLMLYSGALSGAVGNLSVLNPNPNDAYSFTAGGGTVSLNILAANNWNGGAGAPFNWSVNGQWASGSAPTNGQALGFSGAVGLTNTNNITGLNAAGIIFTSSAGTFNLTGNSLALSGGVSNNSANTQTISLNILLTANEPFTAAAGNIAVNGVLSDAGSGFGITVTGPKTLTLAAANTYSGNTNVNGGTLNLANSQAVQNSTVSIGTNGALSFAGGITSPTLGGLAGPGNIALATTAAQPVTLNVGGNLQSTTYSGVLSGAGGLVKTGGGTLTLAAPLANSYSGATLVSGGGVLQLSQGGVIGIQFGPAGSSISAPDGPFPISTWNSVTGTNPTATNLINSYGVATTAAVTVAGAAGTVHDTDTDPLLSNYTYTSTNTLTINLTGIPYSAYSLYAIFPDETANHSVHLTMAGTSFYYLAATPAEDGGAFIQVTNTNSALASSTTGNWAMVAAVSGASQTVTSLSPNDSGFAGLEIVNVGQVLSPNSPVMISQGSTLDMSNLYQAIPSLSSTDGMGSQVLLGAGQLTITGPGVTTFDGVISNGYGGVGGGLVVQGGQLTLTGQNTFTGPATVSGGVLQLNSSSGPALNGTSNLVVSGGTALWLQNNQVNSSGSASVSGGLMNIGPYSNTFAGVQITGGTIAGTSGVITSTGNVDAQNGTINAILGGSAGLNKTTSGTVTLLVANTYTGNTNVTGGNLTLANPLAVQNSTVSVGSTLLNTGVLSYGTLRFAAGNTAPSVGGLTGFSGISLVDATGTNAVALNVGGNGQNTTYSGAMSGLGGLVKQGAGTLTLAGTQAYSGATVVTSGVLQLGPVASIDTLSGFGANTSGLAAQDNGTWQFNTNNVETVTPLTNGVLTLTQSTVGGSARSAFYNNQVPIEAFNASFVYQATGGTSKADGATFIFQNDSRGVDALGAGGGDLGCGTPNAVSPSAELELNVYASNTVGYSFGTSGAITAKTAPGSVNLASGDPIQITLSYDGSNNLALTMLDLSTGTAFNTSLAIGNLATIVGGTSAYLGFTGGDGSVDSTQTISNFNYYYQGTPVTANNVLPATTALSVASGGTVDLYGSNQTVGSLAGSGVVTTSVNALCTLTVAGSMQTFSGQLQDGAGMMGLTIVAPGGVTLTAANAYSGPTNINGGTLQLGTGLANQDGSITGAGGVNNNGLLVYNLFGAQTAAYAIGGSGAVTKTGGGTLTLANGANSYAGGTNVLQGLMVIAPNSGALPYGPLFVSGGSLDLEGNTAVVTALGGSSTIGNGASGVGNLANLFFLPADPLASSTFSGTIQDGGFGGNAPIALQVLNGTLTLTGTGEYSGGTYVEGGTLIATNSEAIEDGSNLYVGNYSFPFGTVVAAGESAAPASALPEVAQTAAAVPEPGTLALLAAVGAATAAAWRSRKSRRGAR